MKFSSFTVKFSSSWEFKKLFQFPPKKFSSFSQENFEILEDLFDDVKIVNLSLYKCLNRSTTC